MALDYRSIQPSEFLAKFLTHGIRPDGRTEKSASEVTINTGSVATADGSALVRAGGTVVLCGVKAELANPPQNSPSQGYLVCGVELPSAPGPPPPRVQALSQALQDALLSSGCIDLSHLCLSEGKLCWVLYVDVVCLSEDGNLEDACVLAASTALTNTRLPTVDTSDCGLAVSLRDRVPLTLSALPLSISYGLFQSHALLDPTAEEEGLCSGRVAITALSNGQITGVIKTGKPALSPESLLRLCKQAQDRAQQLTELIHTASQTQH